MIVAKFGGSSVASLKGAKKIYDIVKSDKNIKFVVVSALGKSQEYSDKITDLLFKVYFTKKDGKDYLPILNLIFDRYIELSKKLKCNINWNKYFCKIIQDIKNGQSKDYIVSRGEYLSSILYSKYLKAKLLDAQDYIIFNKKGEVNYCKTKNKLNSLDNSKLYVIGGYYGSCDNKIKTFDRGGSDITGAIIAKIKKSEVYENYTDVKGVFDKNPNIFTNAKNLPIISYKTALMMADAGNEVVHKDALKELKNTKCLLRVKNTFYPESFGTVLVSDNFYENNLFICMCERYVIKLKKFNNVHKRKILNKADIKQVIFNNGYYYVLLREIYADENYFNKIEDVLFFKKLTNISIFKNIKIDIKNIKKLNKITKKLKNYTFFSKFTAFFNNYLILCEKDKNDFIVSELTKSVY